jgi:LytS/YehU family sensor histidine kinase
MRFMLYETKTEKIALSKELDYIEKYIDLQKIRSANENYIQYLIKGDPAGKLIAPMLFIPFIENAFKHAENKKAENAVKINIEINEEMITFDCVNQFSAKQQVKPDQGGLGNELILKRIKLLYPGKHSLDIDTKNNIYAVRLALQAK